MNWRSPQARFTSFMAVCDHGQLNRLRRSRQGRLPRTRGALKAFGAGLGCLWLRGIASAEFLHADSSAAQPASETLQNRRAIVRFGVFLMGWKGADGLIVVRRTPRPRCSLPHEAAPSGSPASSEACEGAAFYATLKQFGRAWSLSLACSLSLSLARSPSRRSFVSFVLISVRSFLLP